MWLLFEFYLSTDIDNISHCSSAAEKEVKEVESRLREKFSELKPGAAVPPKIRDVIGALMSEKGAFNFCDTTTTSGRDYRRGIHYNSHYAHRRGRQNCSPCLCFLPHPSQNGVFLSFVKSFELECVSKIPEYAIPGGAPPFLRHKARLSAAKPSDFFLELTKNPLESSDCPA